MQIYIFVTQRKVVVWWVLSYSNEQSGKCCRNSMGSNNTNMNHWDLIALLVTIQLWIFNKNQRSVGSSLQCERVYGNFYTSLPIYICEYWIIPILSELSVKSETLYLI